MWFAAFHCLQADITSLIIDISINQKRGCDLLLQSFNNKWFRTLLDTCNVRCGCSFTIFLDCCVPQCGLTCLLFVRFHVISGQEFDNQFLNNTKKHQNSNFDFASFRSSDQKKNCWCSSQLNPGHSIMLLGHAGVGKSSLVKLLNGQMPLQTGQVTSPGNVYFLSQVSNLVQIYTPSSSQHTSVENQ